MAYAGLDAFISKLEQAEELIRVKEFVNPNLEITEITDRISKQDGGGKALLFENNGTNFPVLINAMGSEKRMAMVLGRNSVYDVEAEIEHLFADLMSPKENLWDKLRMLPKLSEVSKWMPGKSSGRGVCQEVRMETPDLSKLPILTCWPADGGPFITLPAVHTVDPETNMPNVGMYRMQVFEKDMTGMHWHRHKTGANHFEKYKKADKKMPVTVTLGGDPAYTYAATAPMPENVNEYLLAGFLRKKKVKLVKCLTNDLYVPEDVDFVIEGYVDPTEELIWEGPFGDHTGFYSLADYYPKFHVTCITHRKNAVYPATIVGVPPMEDAYIGKATERIFLTPIRLTMLPELTDMDLPFAGVAHNLTIVKIDKAFPGHAIKVMHSLWGAGQMMFNKMLVVVDSDVDIHDYNQLLKIFKERFHPAYSLHFSKGPLDVLDHSSQKFAFGSKLGIDLTKPFSEEEQTNELLESTQNFNGDELKSIDTIEDYKVVEHDGKKVFLLLNIKKDTEFKKEKLLTDLSDVKGLHPFKMILFFDEKTNLNNLFNVVWLIGSNLEPERDIYMIASNNFSIPIMDITQKTENHDNFKRDWPNIVIMNDETIQKIDAIWSKLDVGDFIESPSLQYKAMVEGSGAVKNKF